MNNQAKVASGESMFLPPDSCKAKTRSKVLHLPSPDPKYQMCHVTDATDVVALVKVIRPSQEKAKDECYGKEEIRANETSQSPCGLIFKCYKGAPISHCVYESVHIKPDRDLR